MKRTIKFLHATRAAMTLLAMFMLTASTAGAQTTSTFNNHKRLKSYPAVKIGRLAVSENYAHQGVGEQILQYVKALFAFGNRSGCRFLTVDAYADAVSFYEDKGGFKFFTETDINDDTRLLYFDLKPFKDALETVEKQS